MTDFSAARAADLRLLTLIEASSLGTPGARALRERVSPEIAKAIVARANESDGEES